MRIFFVLVLSLVVIRSQAQPQQLTFDESKWPKNQVIHYSKANWDGSNQGLVSIFFKDDHWVEALKWHEGHGQATLVPAKIDFESFNVVHFKNFRCEGGECRQLGEMYWDHEVNGFVLQLGENLDTVKNIPAYWHSYDFDFSSLMVAFLFKNDTDTHQFQRADFHESEGQFTFGPMGEVTMAYQGEKLFKGVKCHLYSIDGPGLNNRGGEIWFDQDSMLLKGFKIREPDESSYNSVDYQFLGQEYMTPEQWETYKLQKY